MTITAVRLSQGEKDRTRAATHVAHFASVSQAIRGPQQHAREAANSTTTQNVHGRLGLWHNSTSATEDSSISAEVTAHKGNDMGCRCIRAPHCRCLRCVLGSKVRPLCTQHGPEAYHPELGHRQQRCSCAFRHALYGLKQSCPHPASMRDPSCGLACSAGLIALDHNRQTSACYYGCRPHVNLVACQLSALKVSTLPSFSSKRSLRQADIATHGLLPTALCSDCQHGMPAAWSDSHVFCSHPLNMQTWSTPVYRAMHMQHTEMLQSFWLKWLKVGGQSHLGFLLHRPVLGFRALEPSLSPDVPLVCAGSDLVWVLCFGVVPGPSSDVGRPCAAMGHSKCSKKRHGGRPGKLQRTEARTTGQLKQQPAADKQRPYCGVWSACGFGLEEEFCSRTCYQAAKLQWWTDTARVSKLAKQACCKTWLL